MKQSVPLQIDPQVPGARIGIIAARFNVAIVDGLLTGALAALHEHGVAPHDVDILYVPGAFEMPLAAQRLAQTGNYDALIALGAVIRGDTAHFEYVAGPCANGLAEVALQQDIPVGFGVLTVNNEQQALERSRPDSFNKGREAALAVLQMVLVLNELEPGAGLSARLLKIHP